MSTNEQISRIARQMTEFDFDAVGSDETYCKIAPGFATILDGVKQIADNFAPSSAKVGIDLAFAAIEAALKSPCNK